MLTTKHVCHLTHTHAHTYTHPHVRTCVFIAPPCHVSTLVGHALGTSGSPRGSVSTYVLTFTAMTEENMVYQHCTSEFHPEVTRVASVLIALATSHHHSPLPRWKECLEGRLEGQLQPETEGLNGLCGGDAEKPESEAGRQLTPEQRQRTTTTPRSGGCEEGTSGSCTGDVTAARDFS